MPSTVSLMRNAFPRISVCAILDATTLTGSSVFSPTGYRQACKRGCTEIEREKDRGRKGQSKRTRKREKESEGGERGREREEESEREREGEGQQRGKK